jgi:hypothetical protein
MGALPNVASSRRYHRTDWRKEKWEQGAKLGIDGRDRITEGWVSTSVILQEHDLPRSAGHRGACRANLCNSLRANRSAKECPVRVDAVEKVFEWSTKILKDRCALRA